MASTGIWPWYEGLPNPLAGAVRILARLEDADPAGVLAASALGDVYRSRERWAEAVDAYGRAIHF